MPPKKLTIDSANEQELINQFVHSVTSGTTLWSVSSLSSTCNDPCSGPRNVSHRYKCLETHPGQMTHDDDGSHNCHEPS